MYKIALKVLEPVLRYAFIPPLTPYQCRLLSYAVSTLARTEFSGFLLVRDVHNFTFSSTTTRYTVSPT